MIIGQRFIWDVNVNNSLDDIFKVGDNLGNLRLNGKKRRFLFHSVMYISYFLFLPNCFSSFTTVQCSLTIESLLVGAVAVAASAAAEISASRAAEPMGTD